MSLAKVLAVHALQADEPADGEYLPGVQVWQASELEAPSPGPYLPDVHALHKLAPFADAYRPVSHGKQVVLLFAAEALE